MESQITLITIVCALKHISREINEVARLLKMKQLMTYVRIFEDKIVSSMYFVLFAKR